MGFTAEWAVNFDFPNIIQFGFGAGVSLYGSKDFSNYRVPSHGLQKGVFPWRADIRRKPGPIWYMNTSFRIKDFIEDLSFFFDYIFAQHNEDNITIMESSTARSELFLHKKVEENSRWRAQVVHFGFNYHVVPGLEFGISAQAHLSGVRVFRTNTILGTITFNF